MHERGVIRLHECGAQDAAGDRCAKNDPVKRCDLFELQPEQLIEVCGNRRLLGGDQTEDQQHRGKVKDFLGGKPANVDQRQLAIEFDQHHAGQGNDRHGQEHAEPWRLEPPVEPPHRQHDGNAAETDGDQQVAEDIRSLDHLRMRHRRQWHEINNWQGHQRQRHLKRIEPMPLPILDQRRRDQPGNRRRDRCACQRQGKSDRQLARRREGLEHIEETERRHGGSRNSADEANDDRRMQIGHEDVHQRNDHEAEDAYFGETAQPVLRTDLDQRDGERNIRRHIGRREPGGLDRGGRRDP